MNIWETYWKEKRRHKQTREDIKKQEASEEA